jgi:hypothetical protein
MPRQGEPPVPAHGGGEWSSHQGGIGRSEERKWVRIGAWWRCMVLDFFLKGRRGGGDAVGVQVGFHGVRFGSGRSTEGGEAPGRIRKTQRRKSVARPGDEKMMSMERNGK